MPAFCTQADVQSAAGGADRLRDLADWNADGVADSSVITERIDEASAWMARWLSNRYPIATIEAAAESDVVRECAREVVYRLRESRDALTDRDETQHEARLEWLRDVAAGRAKLNLEPSPEAATSAEAGITSEATSDGDDQSLTRDNLGGAAW